MKLMRSITTKLILAFLGIGILSVAFISISVRWNTRNEFINFLTDQNRNDLASQLATYHIENGSWQGVETSFTSFNKGMELDDYPGHRMMETPFALCDETGSVIFSTEKRWPTGSRISDSELEAGTPITNNGKVIGILLSPRTPFQGNPRELEFIERTNLTLIYIGLGAALLALLLGIFLSRTLTRPLRELTNAAHAISQGDLVQQVSVRSQDELGELAQAFNKMSAELSRSINTRKQMTADIAHELRTPLSLILGHAEAVHDGVLQPSRENFEIIREEAVRLEHLINDLRILSLADAGELRITPQPVEPDRLLNEVAALYQYQLRVKNISLTVDIDTSLPTLELDSVRMTQVLTNILDNAIRHTPENGRITLSAGQIEHWVKLSVQDSGPGVSPENLEHLFERFYRTDSSRQREAGGSGLGLAIAKSIVQAHNGQIWAESEAGNGLMISIQLPVKAQE